MPRIKTTIQTGPIIRSTISQTGAVGPRGPNVVTHETETPLTGVLVGDGESIRVATPSEVISEAAMQSALPMPLRIHSGEVFTVPANRQMPFRYPITVEPGAQLIIPANSILYQA